MQTLDDINKKLEEHSKKLVKLQLDMDKIHWAPPRRQQINADGPLAFLSSINVKTLVLIIVGLLVQLLLSWFLIKRSLTTVTTSDTREGGDGDGGESAGNNSN